MSKIQVMQNLILTLLMASFLAISCNKKTNPNDCPDYKYGTVVDMTGLDGCGFNIRLDNGTLLEPINLDKYPQIKINNQRIQFTYKDIDDRMSICMVGPMVEITCAETIAGQ